MGLGIAQHELLELSEVDRAKPAVVAAGGSTMGVGAGAITGVTEAGVGAITGVTEVSVAPPRPVFFQVSSIIQRSEASAAATIDRNRRTIWHSIGNWPTCMVVLTGLGKAVVAAGSWRVAAFLR